MNELEHFFATAGRYEDDLRQLDALIREAAPHLAPTMVEGMFGKMLGYGLVPYRTKSMKEPGEWPLLAIAAQKNYISIYACVVIDGQYIAEKYESQLGKANCGKSCIRFKRLSDINPSGLQTLLRDIDTRYQSGEKLY